MLERTLATTRRLRALAAGCAGWIKRDGVSGLLDGVLRTSERLFALIFSCVIFYGGYALAFGSNDQYEWAADRLKFLHDNWRAALILLVPLFYSTVRLWIQKAKHLLGASQPEDPPATATNPPA